MARRSISIDEKIEQQKKIVFNLKDIYEAALAELDKLQQKSRTRNSSKPSRTAVVHSMR